MKFHVPPRNQGQMVEYAYACEDGLVFERRIDGSDGSVTFMVSEALKDDEGEYWNGPPRNKRWRKPTRAELARYGLEERMGT